MCRLASGDERPLGEPAAEGDLSSSKAGPDWKMRSESPDVSAVSECRGDLDRLLWRMLALRELALEDLESGRTSLLEEYGLLRPLPETDSPPLPFWLDAADADAAAAAAAAAAVAEMLCPPCPARRASLSSMLLARRSAKRMRWFAEAEWLLARVWGWGVGSGRVRREGGEARHMKRVAQESRARERVRAQRPSKQEGCRVQSDAAVRALPLSLVSAQTPALASPSATAESVAVRGH